MSELFWKFLQNNRNTYWKGFCNLDRNKAIYDIELTINKYGFITDYHMFSDLEISLKIEIEEKQISGLYETLRKYMALTETDDLRSDSDKERTIMLNVTFLNGTGDLKIDVPVVPG